MTDMVAIPQDRRSVRFATHALEIGFAILFVVLAWNNFTLRRQLAAAAVTPARSGADANFVAGDRLGRLDVLDLTGRKASLDLSTGRTLVAVVNPTCKSCVQTVAELSAARLKNARVLSVASPAETSPLVTRANLAAFTSVVPPNLNGDTGRKLVHFPQVLVVDQGTVVRTCKTVAECSR
ncbi:MAG TPA: hypothetical protein VGF69_23620 [Thermoanaerobaculia bacterium]|jgi:hypothetical protein